MKPSFELLTEGDQRGQGSDMGRGLFHSLAAPMNKRLPPQFYLQNLGVTISLAPAEHRSLVGWYHLKRCSRKSGPELFKAL